MKIPAQASPPQWSNTINKNRQDAKPSAEPAASRKRRTAQHINNTQHRISHWFASIGIAPATLEYPTHQAQQIADYQRLRLQKQINNLQQIMSVALSVSATEQTEEHIDPDWFHSFISMAENIHSSTMQELWGKILAVEIQRPGSFSMRSLETLTKLTQRDASLFSQACQIACRRNNDPAPIIITGFHQQPGLFNTLFSAPSAQTQLGQYGLSYTDILALGSMKLLYATEIETGLMDKGSSVALKFSTQNLTLQAKSRNMLMTYYKFTAVGSELARLLPKQNSETFTTHIKTLFTPHFSVE